MTSSCVDDGGGDRITIEDVTDVGHLAEFINESGCFLHLEAEPDETSNQNTPIP